MNGDSGLFLGHPV